MSSAPNGWTRFAPRQGELARCVFGEQSVVVRTPSGSGPDVKSNLVFVVEIEPQVVTFGRRLRHAEFYTLLTDRVNVPAQDQGELVRFILDLRTSLYRVGRRDLPPNDTIQYTPPVMRPLTMPRSHDVRLPLPVLQTAWELVFMQENTNYQPLSELPPEEAMELRAFGVRQAGTYVHCRLIDLVALKLLAEIAIATKTWPRDDVDRLRPELDHLDQVIHDVCHFHPGRGGKIQQLHPVAGGMVRSAPMVFGGVAPAPLASCLGRADAGLVLVVSAARAAEGRFTAGRSRQPR